jgi:hypothetical protein
LIDRRRLLLASGAATLLVPAAAWATIQGGGGGCRSECGGGGNGGGGPSEPGGSGRVPTWDDAIGSFFTKATEQRLMARLTAIRPRKGADRKVGSVSGQRTVKLCSRLLRTGGVTSASRRGEKV